ncbi:Panacea domain-containing protein [uncultured Roseobacter sp.]|uniref:Panacea domain-containing protein n=1 Tax=uncultured Roseobacter sp. TaxID=114847 RepID=UPI0026353FD8|nr:Panacea domain-containing protein [uncultured Roseobacter sp.]
MYLQKLVYISNGWNLVINRETLISERPQAWDNGPVYVSLWRHVKDWGYQGVHCELVSPLNGEIIRPNLNKSEKDIIDHVWARYGNYTAAQLSDMTHEPGTPWTKAYVGRGRNSELDDNEVFEHYTKLALAGRQQRAQAESGR